MNGRTFQRPGTDEPEGCSECSSGHTVASRVARFVDTVQRDVERRAVGQAPARRVTANSLFDDRAIEVRRLRWYGAGATVIAVACSSLFVWQQLAPPAVRTHAAHRVTIEASHPIEETARVGEMTVIVSHIASMARRARVHLFAINAGDSPLPGGVTLKDGEGNEIEVIPATDEIPARTVEHRVIDVGEGFNPRSESLRIKIKRRNLQ